MCRVSLLLLASLLALFLNVHSQECRMNNAYIKDSKSTFVFRGADGKDQLQRFNFIKHGSTLHLYCYDKTGKLVEKSLKCNRMRFEPPDPIECSYPLKSVVRQLTDTDINCLATMYSIGITIKDQFLELYRACYDKAKVRSYFSEATIYWKPIHPPSPRPDFTIDNLITVNQGKSFDKISIYYEFIKIYGERQRYIRKFKSGEIEQVINRGHLTASGDMLFNDQMNSTFKYVNVVPQFQTINDGNWNLIEMWIGNNIPLQSVLHVRTGALEVLSLPHSSRRQDKPAYLISKDLQNPVPEWMYKIVSDAHKKLLHVFLTYNNVFLPKKPTAHKCCQVVPCPTTLILTDNKDFGFSYCCNPQHFVECLPKRS